MQVKIFSALHYKSDIEEMEREINDFLSEDGGDIIDTYFRVSPNSVYYCVEYEDDEEN